MLDLPRKSLKFKKLNRLASKADFQSVFASPHKLSRPSFRVLYLASDKPDARLGIVISKQQVRQAVDRNRLRRIARESFRHQQDLLKGLDIVLIMRSECISLCKKTLRDKIDCLWSALTLPSSSLTR